MAYRFIAASHVPAWLSNLRALAASHFTTACADCASPPEPSPPWTFAGRLPAQMSNLPVLIAPLLQGRLPQGQLPDGLLRQGAGEHHAGRLGRVPRALTAVQRVQPLF